MLLVAAPPAGPLSHADHYLFFCGSHGQVREVTAWGAQGLHGRGRCQGADASHGARRPESCDLCTCAVLWVSLVGLCLSTRLRHGGFIDDVEVFEFDPEKYTHACSVPRVLSPSAPPVSPLLPPSNPCVVCTRRWPCAAGR